MKRYFIFVSRVYKNLEQLKIQVGSLSEAEELAELIAKNFKSPSVSVVEETECWGPWDTRMTTLMKWSQKRSESKPTFHNFITA